MPDASDSSSISTKRRALPIPPAHLSQHMTVHALTEVLASLHFNARRQTRLVVDPSVRTFLLKAIQAAAADPDLTNLTIRQVLNRHAIRPPR